MRTWILLFLLVLSPLGFAKDLINKVLPITYAKPAQIEAALKPLLKPGETMSVYNQSLIVHVSEDTLTQMRSLIHQLDLAPSVFIISIHQGDAQWLNEPQDSIHYSATGKQAQENNQSVQVQSGSYAYVSTGTDTPVVSQVSAGWVTGVGYDRMKSDKGFLIQPELQGSKVKITIKRMFAQQNRVNQQDQQDQQTATTTLIPLNKWVALSQSRGPENPTAKDSVSYEAGNSFDTDGTLYIKIELVKN